MWVYAICKVLHIREIFSFDKISDIFLILYYFSLLFYITGLIF